MRSLTLAGVLALLITGAANAASPSSADVEASRQAVIAAVTSDPVNFGGVYIERDGTLVIQTVGQNAGEAAVAAKLVPGVAVRWEKVARNQLELLGTAVAIRDLNLEGVNAIAVDTIGNQVKVTVGPSGSAADVRSDLLAVAKDGVLVESTDNIFVTETCTNRLSCTRWRGGILINEASGAGVCTWGYQGARAGLLQMITAGHCAATGAKFTHGGITIGTSGVARNAIDPANFDGFDLERTFSNGTYYPTTQNIIYATDSYKSWTLTSVMSQANLVVGVRAAKSGIATDYTNGYVLAATVFYKLVPANGAGSLVMYPTCTYQNQGPCPTVQGVLTDAASAGGDSGSPFFTWIPTSPPMQHVFLGILSSGNGSQTIFAPAWAGTQSAVLDLDSWCTTSSC